MTKSKPSSSIIELVVLNGELEGQRYTVFSGLQLGRSRDADIALPDAKCSRRHARVDAVDGGFVIVDLKSHNGIHVNDKRVPDAPLSNGDVIRIGRTRLAFVTRPTGSSRPASEPTLPSANVRRWDTATPPPIEALAPRDFLAAVGVPAQHLADAQAEPERRLLAQARNFALLHQLVGRLPWARGPSDWLNTAITYLFWVIPADRAHLLYLDAETGDLESIVSRRRDAEDESPDGFSRTIAERVLALGGPLSSADASKDIRFGERSSIEVNRIRSLLAAPLRADQRVVGVIQLDRQDDEVFDEDDAQLLTVVGALLGPHVLAAVEDRTPRPRQLDRLLMTQRWVEVGHLALGFADELLTWLMPLASTGLVGADDPDAIAVGEFLDDVDAVRARVADTASTLIRLLRNWSEEPSLIEIDLAQTVRDALALARLDPDLNVHDLVEAIHMAPSTLHDAPRITLLVLQLLRNASQSLSQPGTIRVKLVRDPNDVHSIRLSVEDDGPGIAPGDQPLVFEPFFTRREVGLGLGLTVCRQIALDHAGEIVSQPREDSGTVIVVRLPIVTKDPDDTHGDLDEP